MDTEERDDMPKETGRDKWLMGSVVAVALVAAASMWVMGVANAAADAVRRATALELRVAVGEAQRDESNRRLNEMSMQIGEVNRKLDWLIRRAGPGSKDNNQ